MVADLSFGVWGPTDGQSAATDAIVAGGEGIVPGEKRNTPGEMPCSPVPLRVTQSKNAFPRIGSKPTQSPKYLKIRGSQL